MNNNNNNNNKLFPISNVDIAKSAAVLNICCECKKDFLQCVERSECAYFYDNYKTAIMAMDMYEKLKIYKK